MAAKLRASLALPQSYESFQKAVLDTFENQSYAFLQTPKFTDFLLDCAATFKSYRRRSLLVKYARDKMETQLKKFPTDFVVATSEERYVAQSMLLSTKYQYTPPIEWGKTTL
ncbi:MAG: hypothetical protein ACRCYY_14210 [Trueperaceae bacterium]